MTHRPARALQCPKCGSTRGWAGPSYAQRFSHASSFEDPIVREDLLYTCRRCGYDRRTPTKDAAPPPQPNAKNPWTTRKSWLSRVRAWLMG